jgi:poly(hydroxyalkanoate) depolymerase family esterase
VDNINNEETLMLKIFCAREPGVTHFRRLFAIAAVVLGSLVAAQAHAGFTYHVTQAASSASGSKDRYFSYYVPSTYVAGRSAPLYVVLHGCRIDDRAMTDNLGMETFAERDGAIILYPFQNNDASANDNDGRNPNCWGYWLSANIHRDQGEPGDIKRMVDNMKSRFTIDNDRVHVTGISSGGAMTTIMQVTYPDVFASSVMVEGIGYSETAATYTGTSACADVLNYGLGTTLPASSVISNMRTEMQKSRLRQPPVMVIHNKKDCTVPMKVGQGLIDSFMGLLGADGKAISTTATSTSSGSVDGLPYTWSKYGKDTYGNSLIETVILDASAQQVAAAGVVALSTDPYDASGASNTVVKEDVNRGHWWPGAARRAPWIINKGINANQLAADFFRSHPMNGSGGTTTTTTGGTTTTTGMSTTTTGVSTTTTATVTTTTVAAVCYTSSNYAHVTAGRAHVTSGYAYANGSNQNMGLNNTFTSKTLKKTATNYYVIGTCP